MTPDEIIEVLQGVKAGRKWEYEDEKYSWFTPINQGLFSLFFHLSDEYNVRLAPLPDEITIPARVIPAPLREAPKVGAPAFLADPTMTEYCYPFRWEDCMSNRMLLERGLVYATSENAIAASKAMYPYA